MWLPSHERPAREMSLGSGSYLRCGLRPLSTYSAHHRAWGPALVVFPGRPISRWGPSGDGADAPPSSVNCVFKVPSPFASSSHQPVRPFPPTTDPGNSLHPRSQRGGLGGGEVRGRARAGGGCPAPRGRHRAARGAATPLLPPCSCGSCTNTLAQILCVCAQCV